MRKIIRSQISELPSLRPVTVFAGPRAGIANGYPSVTGTPLRLEVEGQGHPLARPDACTPFSFALPSLPLTSRCFATWFLIPPLRRIVLDSRYELNKMHSPASPWRPIGPSPSTLFRKTSSQKLWVDVDARILATVNCAWQKSGDEVRVESGQSGLTENSERCGNHGGS